MDYPQKHTEEIFFPYFLSYEPLAPSQEMRETTHTTRKPLRFRANSDTGVRAKYYLVNQSKECAEGMELYATKSSRF